MADLKVVLTLCVRLALLLPGHCVSQEISAILLGPRVGLASCLNSLKVLCSPEGNSIIETEHWLVCEVKLGVESLSITTAACMWDWAQKVPRLS